MKILPRILFLLFVLVSQQGHSQDYREVLLFGRFELDTIHINVIRDVEIDSVIHYSYVTNHYSKNGEWEDTISLLFPLNSDTINNMWHSDRGLVYLSPNMYGIERFTYDDLSGEDEEWFYFYCHGIGVIMEISLAWDIQKRLLDVGDPHKNTTIMFICEKILNMKNLGHER